VTCALCLEHLPCDLYRCCNGSAVESLQWLENPQAIHVLTRGHKTSLGDKPCLLKQMTHSAKEHCWCQAACPAVPNHTHITEATVWQLEMIYSVLARSVHTKKGCMFSFYHPDYPIECPSLTDVILHSAPQGNVHAIWQKKYSSQPIFQLKAFVAPKLGCYWSSWL